MLKLIKRITSGILAAAMFATTAASMPVVTAEESDVVFHSECEDLTLLDGAEVWTSIYQTQLPGYSGEGFIYLTNGTMEFEVEVPESGMYDISVRYCQILDENGREQTIAINDFTNKKFLVKFPYADTWTDFSFGKFRLDKGVNTIRILPQYGYAAYDTVTVTKASLPELNIEPKLSDPEATPETQGLMNYLCDVYGKHILSGQQEIYGGGHTESSPNGYSGDELLGYESEFEWIKKNFGDYPAIRGFDLMNYNPLYGWDDGSTERIIEWGERNGIPTVCWHINLPLDFASYEVGEPLDWEKCSYKNNDTFDVAKATVEGTKEYEYTMLTIDCLAQELLKVQEAGVPVIFRPYHEAEGNGGINGEGAWFWWSQDGAEAYKALWRQLYTTLTEKYGIHNLIWEFNSYDYATSPEWYPGDEWVDMVGFDKYNTVYNRHDGLTSGPNEDAISGTFYNLVDIVDNKKLVAMPENDTVPSLENILVEKAHWLYFCIWYDNGSENFLSGEDKNNPETLKEMYQSDYCITLSELPDWKKYDMEYVPTEPTTEAPTDPTEPIVSAESQYEITLDSEPVKWTYYHGTEEELDLTGLTVSLDLYDSEGKKNNVYSEVSPLDYPDVFIVDTSEFDISVPGTYTITISCTDEYQAFLPTAPVSFEVDVIIPGITEPTDEPIEYDPSVVITIDSLPDKTVYDIGEYLDFSGLTVTVDHYYGEDSHDVIYEKVNPMDYPESFVIDASDYDGSTPGTYTIEISVTDDFPYGYQFLRKATYEVEVVGDGTYPTVEPPTSGNEITVPEDAEATKYGDVNLDNTVDAADVVAINLMLLGSGEYTPVQIANADCAKDWVINSADSTLLMNYVSMIITADNLGVDVWVD